jgi:hypothetical protein
MVDTPGNLTAAELGKISAGKRGNLGRAAAASQRAASPSTTLLRRPLVVQQRVVGGLR